MKTILSQFLSVLGLTALIAAPSLARADNNWPANECQIYIAKVKASPNSHGSAATRMIIRVPFLGEGKIIQKVGFHGMETRIDRGNSPDCHMDSGNTSTGFRDVGPISGPNAQGEYEFTFPIRSGSVVSSCPGFSYNSVGAFFVQTNQGTYWLNPDMDSNKNFVFDANGYEYLEKTTSFADFTETTRDDLRKYYNPASCPRSGK